MKYFILSLYTLVLLCSLQAELVKKGQGSYTTAKLGDFTPPPSKNYRTPKATGPIPTNDWWSSILWETFSSNHFPHPLGIKCEAKGLRIANPGASLNTFERGVISAIPANGSDLTIGLSDTEKFMDARVESHSDWFLTVRFGSDDRFVRCTYGHGSPFVYAEAKGSAPALHFEQPPKIWHRSAGITAITTITGNHYAIFCPKKIQWQGTNSKTWTRTNKEGHFLSIALLPDNTPETLKRFAQHAHAHVTGTKVEWRYDSNTSRSIATFTLSTEARDGSSSVPLITLYPHQWRRTSADLLPLSYQSIRGPMKLFAGKSFEVAFDFPGVLPCLPLDVEGLTGDLRRLLEKKDIPKDSYWGGKALGNLASGSAIASTCNHPELSKEYVQRIKNELEDWLSFDGNKGDRHFYFDSNWGSLIGIPPSYGSAKELNDHHFHYGYFFRAAAEIARNDPSWMKETRWGSMMSEIIDDVACPRRNDPKFPFLRNFDPYAGHSWASGHARFADGNNQESSSEAMSAWTGLILLGEFTNNKAMRDLGIYLYSSELAAIEDYWFDVTGTHYPDAMKAPSIAMIWGGKSTYETWFSDAPHCKTGINLLPIHGGSLYLGRYPEFVRANHDLTLAASGGKWKGWPSIMISYRALVDAEKALGDWTALGKSPNLDSGNFPANARHWIENLRRLGQLDRKVTCNHPISATFRSKSGRVRHVVYISGQDPVQVTFSDGVSFQALPGQFTVK